MLLLPVIATAEQGADPRRVVLLVTVAVLAVVHHLPVADTLLMVYLPEDDATLLRDSQPVAHRCPDHLLEAEIAIGDDGPAELAVGRQAPHPQEAAGHPLTAERSVGIWEQFVEFHLSSF